MAPKSVHADITLLLDMEGVIREATLSPAMAAESVDGWLGRLWSDIAGDGGGEKVRRMVEDARRSGISAFRQINQPFPSGIEIPIEFTTMLLGDRTGMIAVGKNMQAVSELHSRLMAAQQAMERDYWRLRELETRYRLVFDAAADAVMIVSAGDMRIVEANRAAVGAISRVERINDDVVGRDFLAEVAAADRDAVRDMLAQVRERGSALSVLVHLGRYDRAWMLRGSLMSSERRQVFLLHFTPVTTSAIPEEADDDSVLRGLIDRIPDGFVALDSDGIVRHANQAFLDLVQVGSKPAAVGRSLGCWLGRPGADLTSLLTLLRRYKTVRLYQTTIRGELGSETEIEVSAVDGDDDQYIGVLLRNVARRLGEADDNDALRQALGPISKQLGRSSLRKLVKNAVSIVEQHYVKEALVRSRGNRTATAELLGLSRQSLYAKLSRYGFDDKGANSAAADKDGNGRSDDAED
ncbi:MULTISPECIES: transcriptional regulator PpsR [Rhodopseudomonas]|uniref:transcriptional regulator PpsR n=1 Tax=Rhodopseudomonas TaxID=1073 RepID=UPI0006424352|nr:MULTISPECIES: transcriptional regulator PpsR [Rhodopseudomonas]NEW86530.1 transcriptional regulator PpsR [Rhodopseudomonas sp. WA056]QDM00086.1 transcriptional regulator PpsR [Rhodopseudomonas palustris]